MDSPDLETVHTMTDYYDGPRGGVADYLGRPHIYESEWSDSEGNYADTFLLSPIENDLLGLAVEDWEIFLSWRRAFEAGKATRDTHPALPEDRERHREVERLLEGRLEIDKKSALRANGQFEMVGDQLMARWVNVIRC